MASGRRSSRGTRRREKEEELEFTSGPPTRQGWRHHAGGYVIPSNAHLTPESQAVRDYQGFVSEGSPHTAYNYPMTSAGPDAIAKQDYERRTNIEPFSWYKGNYGKENTEGMLSGLGKHLLENNPISLRFQELQTGVDAYDNYWLTRLGHEGTPLKEDYNNEDDFMIDYKRYWDERPLDYTWFNHYGD